MTISARRTLGSIAASIALLAGLLMIGLAWVQWRIQHTELRSPEQAAPGGRWLHAYDTDVHVQEWGAANAPVLLLVHGTGAWAGTWASNVRAMTAAGFRVVALDLPPFGFSRRPETGDYSRQAQARRILGVIEQLNAGPVTLLGHSFGGGPAAEAAMQSPATITHLVLVDAAIGMQGDRPAPCQAPWLAEAILERPRLRNAVFAAAVTQPAFSQFWLRQFVARKEVVTPERTAIYQQPFVVRGFSAGLAAWARQFALGCEFPASVRPAGFRALPMPVSLIWGELDDVTPIAQARQLKSLLPRAGLTALPGVGHIPQIEDVPAFDAALARVLREPPH